MLRALRPFCFAIVLAAFVSFSASPVFARSGPTGFADLAEKLLPAVVNISTSQTVSNDDLSDLQELQIPPGSPFEDFFKEFLEKQGRSKNGHPKKHKATSLGSGFIIDPSGYIVTNDHVVQDADEITVILQDDTNLSAKIVGRDKKTDLALLKVESKKPLTAVAWGDSDKIRVGDWIMAIGNPFGLGGTVTAGIISARARDINSGPYDDYLQTDAPINRGNSGGPMFDMDGEVIGVNTAIFSPSGGSIGIGFAVPSSMAKSVIEQLKTSGHVRRGWLGVRIQTVTKEIADGLSMGKPRGALVSSITPDSPAAKAHFEPGDVIVAFDGKDVSDMHRLPRLVAEAEVDKSVPVSILRKGKEIVLNVRIAELTASSEEAQDKSDEKESSRAPSIASTKVETLGLSVANITDDLRKRYDLDKESSGLVVVSVASGGVAADYGLMQGDVISQASQLDVNSGKDLEAIAKKAKKDKKPLLLLIDRKGDMRFVAVNFAKESADNKPDNKDDEE